MKNGDKPINPVEVSSDGNGNITGIQTGNYSGWETGLTKREYFAGLAMQGLLALTDKGTYSSLDEGIERLCEFSVKFADELLKQLENK